MNDNTIREMLAMLRSLDAEEYYANIYAISALGRRLKTVPDPWNRDESTLIYLRDEAVACVEAGAIEGMPEAHAWYQDPRTVEEMLAHTVVERLYLSLSNLHPPMRGLGDADTRLRETMFLRPPSRRRSELSGLVILSEHGAEAISSTGAYSYDLAKIMLQGGAEAVTLTGDDGLWRSRYRLESLDEGVAEVCGVETNPKVMKRGWATRMLRATTSNSTHVYLARESNIPSKKTAKAAGFRAVCSFDKFLLGRSSGQPR